MGRNLLTMTNGPSLSRLVRKLIALFAAMLLIPVAFGYGMGAVEMSIWFGLLVVGAFLTVRGHIVAQNGNSAH